MRENVNRGTDGYNKSDSNGDKDNDNREQWQHDHSVNNNGREGGSDCCDTENDSDSCNDNNPDDNLTATGEIPKLTTQLLWNLRPLP